MMTLLKCFLPLFAKDDSQKK